LWGGQVDDQLVATWARCTVLEAHELAEINVQVYHEYLWLQMVRHEADKLRAQFEATERKQKEQRDKFTQSTMGRRR
jgi:hypothetical protein